MSMVFLLRPRRCFFFLSGGDTLMVGWESGAAVIMMGGTVLAEKVAQGSMTGRAEAVELDTRYRESRTVKQGRKQKEIGATNANANGKRQEGQRGKSTG